MGQTGNLCWIKKQSWGLELLLKFQECQESLVFSGERNRELAHVEGLRAWIGLPLSRHLDRAEPDPYGKEVECGLVDVTTRSADIPCFSGIRAQFQASQVQGSVLGCLRLNLKFPVNFDCTALSLYILKR